MLRVISSPACCLCEGFNGLYMGVPKFDVLGKDLARYSREQAHGNSAKKVKKTIVKRETDAALLKLQHGRLISATVRMSCVLIYAAKAATGKRKTTGIKDAVKATQTPGFLGCRSQFRKG